jgi:hypothetical protein
MLRAYEVSLGRKDVANLGNGKSQEFWVFLFGGGVGWDIYWELEWRLGSNGFN